MIKQFIQGSEDDEELFCLVGGWVVDKNVHKELGTPITGIEGDVWHVYEEKHKPLGFAETRIQKNLKGHIRFVFSDRPSIKSKLVEAVMNAAREMNLESVFTYDREDSEVWREMGFKKCHKHGHSHFYHWEKSLKELKRGK